MDEEPSGGPWWVFVVLLLAAALCGCAYVGLALLEVAEKTPLG